MLLLTAHQETNQILSSLSLWQAAAPCPLPLPPAAHLTVMWRPFAINVWEGESKHEDRNSSKSLQLVYRKRLISSCRYLSCILKQIFPFCNIRIYVKKKGNITNLLLKTTVENIFCRGKITGNARQSWYLFVKLVSCLVLSRGNGALTT